MASHDNSRPARFPHPLSRPCSGRTDDGVVAVHVANRNITKLYDDFYQIPNFCIRFHSSTIWATSLEPSWFSTMISTVSFRKSLNSRATYATYHSTLIPKSTIIPNVLARQRLVKVEQGRSGNSPFFQRFLVCSQLPQRQQQTSGFLSLRWRLLLKVEMA